jgi:hypothetical protein
MKEPKVQIKNIKYHQGHEWQGVNADVFINSKKVFHVHDDGNGGCLDIDLVSFDAETKALGHELQNYVDSIPEKPLDFGNGPVKDDKGNVRMEKTTLEDYINNLLIDIEKKKVEKKMQKLMLTAILIGVPNADRYSYFNFKRPLSTIPRTTLQAQVAIIKMKNCKNGVQILNTNLQALGITF